MKKIFAIISLLAITACGTVPVKYEAQNFYRVEDAKKTEVTVGDFNYIPFNEGKLDANQLHNTAMGRIYIATNVADYVKRATALELEKSGYKLSDKAKLKIQADILDFTADDLGYSIDWDYSVKYKIYDNEKNTLVFEKVYKTESTKTGKFGLPEDYTPSINEKILNGYDLFIRDSDAQDERCFCRVERQKQAA